MEIMKKRCTRIYIFARKNSAHPIASAINKK